MRAPIFDAMRHAGRSVPCKLKEEGSMGSGIEDHSHFVEGSCRVAWIRVTTVGPLLERLQLWIIMCKHQGKCQTLESMFNVKIALRFFCGTSIYSLLYKMWAYFWRKEKCHGCILTSCYILVKYKRPWLFKEKKSLTISLPSLSLPCLSLS